MILHEYGHAIQDDQVPGFGHGLRRGAIGEGFGDYWAAAMSSRSPGTPNADDVCIFDWDGITWGSYVPAFHRRCGRRADSDQTPARGPGQVSVRDPLRRRGLVERPVGPARRSTGSAPATFDRIVLSSQFMYTANEHFDDGGGGAWSPADQALTGGANKAAICDRDGDPARDLRRQLPLAP